MSGEKRGRRQRKVPQWAARHPFPPGEKRPALLTREHSIPRVYGDGAHRIATYLHLSTDRLTCTEFHVGPGEWFEPPDLHAGDEVYYVLRGEPAVLNPETGEVLVVQEGEFLLIPKGTWHQAHNFASGTAIVLCSFAPKIWSEEQPMPADFPGHLLVYKGPERKVGSPDPPSPGAGRLCRALVRSQPLAAPPLQLLGHWPGEGPELRKNKQMVPVGEREALKVIHGESNRLLACFYVSNDFLHVGLLHIPAGPPSEPEEHQGDEVIYVVQGSLSVLILEEQTSGSGERRFEVHQGERFLIPEGYKHQYCNFSPQPAKALFSIAPEL